MPASAIVFSSTLMLAYADSICLMLAYAFRFSLFDASRTNRGLCSYTLNPKSLTAPFSKQAPLVGVHMGLWPEITGGKSAAFMEGGQVQVLGSFGDTASHLPDCCSLHALVSDAEGPYLNRPFSAEVPS